MTYAKLLCKSVEILVNKITTDACATDSGNTVCITSYYNVVFSTHNPFMACRGPGRRVSPDNIYHSLILRNCSECLCNLGVKLTA